MSDFSRISRSSLCVAAAIFVSVAIGSVARAADMATKSPPPIVNQSDVNSSVLFVGSDFKSNAAGGAVGGIYALNGNLDASGWLVRGQASYVGYEYNQNPVLNGYVIGNVWDAAAAIGYQVSANGWVASAMVGPDYQSFSPNPAFPPNPIVRDQWGAAFFGRLATAGGAQFPTSIEGEYSTANESFWVRGRIGARFGALVVGPEAIGLGDIVYDEFRIGGYASYDVTSKFIVQADLGYAAAFRESIVDTYHGGTGVYGGVALIFLH